MTRAGDILDGETIGPSLKKKLVQTAKGKYEEIVLMLKGECVNNDNGRDHFSSPIGASAVDAK